MAPIVLKVKGNMQSLPFGNDSSDDLSKTWRVCTKVKDSLENGSRLENLSWRLWFAHNVNDSTKKKSTVSPAASALLRNFKVPDNFDFKAQKKTKTNAELEADYRRKLSLQQKKQAEQKIQDAVNKMIFAAPKPSSSKETNRKCQLQQQQQPQQQQQQQQQSVYTYARPSKEFKLHQYTSDQANDQVIELDDIFKSFGDDMQAYLDPSEENLTSQQLDNLINESWPLSCASSIHDPYGDDSLIHSNVTSPVTLNFASSAMAPPAAAVPRQQQQVYSQLSPQEYSVYNGYNTNNNNEIDNLQSSALYVSSETMPPIPLGTLHNKLLTTLPKETLESAGRLLSNKSDVNHDMMIDQKPHSTSTFHSAIQSTPTTPFASTPSSFLTPRQGSHLNPQQQLLQQQMEEPSYQFFVQQQQQPAPAPNQHQHNNIPTSYTFSYHNHPQSKSLPPSRATSPPPCDTGGSSSSASSSPTSVLSPSSSPKKRATVAINSSPSEGKAPICSNCNTTSTPLWRRSANDELLCNACGLYLKLHNAPRPKYLKPQSSRKDSKGEDENVVQPLCSNCGTSTTPLWRRDLDGAPLCNACGLYLKLHHEKRPLSMKTDNIKKRQRCDNGSSVNVNKVSSVTSNTSKRKNHRMIDEPLTTTVTFDTKYQYMEDVLPSNSATPSSSSSMSDSNYSPFGQFGLTITHQPI